MAATELCSCITDKIVSTIPASTSSCGISSAAQRAPVDIRESNSQTRSKEMCFHSLISKQIVVNLIPLGLYFLYSSLCAIAQYYENHVTIMWIFTTCCKVLKTYLSESGNKWNAEKFYHCHESRRVAQLVSALPSVLELSSSILSDSNVCSNFSLICV